MIHASPFLWIVFNVFILILLGVDLFFHRKEKILSLREAIYWSIGWIGLSLLFNAGIYLYWGKEPALAFFTGYLVEKSLSVDNLFVFILIFRYFHTPAHLLHKVLFWGVLGAILMRAALILVGISLIYFFQWMFYLFGILLIIMGIKLALEKDKEIHPEKNPLLKIARRCFPITPDYHGSHFFKKIGGKLYMTPLFVVLLVIESSDLIFAIDSIPVILGITLDPFIVYTSNIFAILGLRSLFFVLSNLLEIFTYLHYGIACILVFIGFKMLFSTLFHISTLITLCLVIFILAISIFLSLYFPPKSK